ncbi:MAG: hypothetical protein ABUL60_26000 [Myxococcales bacterium]
MAQQAFKSERGRTAWRRQARATGRPTGGCEAARVVVAWSSSDMEAGRCLAPVNLELETAATGGTWRCRELSGASWVEAISAARCTEVVLTARLGEDGRARHRVLELAELLTQRLSATKPHIRVRFLPTLAEPAAADAKSA